MVGGSDLSILVLWGIHVISAVTPKFLGFSGLAGHQEAAASKCQGASLGGVEVQGGSRCYAASPHTQGGTMPYAMTAPRSGLYGQGTPPQATPVHMLGGWAATGEVALQPGCSGAALSLPNRFLGPGASPTPQMCGNTQHGVVIPFFGNCDQEGVGPDLRTCPCDSERD